MKKILSIILALTMIISIFALVSCGDSNTSVTTTKGEAQTTTKENPVTTTSPVTDVTDVPASSKEPEATTVAIDVSGTPGVSTTIVPEETTASALDGKTKHPDFMDVNFGGRTFTFLTKVDTDDWDGYHFYAEATGDDSVLTEGIIQRNAIVESLYNCKIQRVQAGTSTDGGANALVQNDLAIGQCNYDIVAVDMNIQKPGSNYYNLAALDIDLSHSWWDQDFIQTFQVNSNGTKKLQALSGDFNILAYDAIWTMFFNKRVYETMVATGKTSIDLYQTVRDGKWTVDTMIELMTAAATDVDGDQVMSYDKGDIFGLVGIANGLPERAIFYGIGGRGSIYSEEEQKVVAISTSNYDIAGLSAAIDKAQAIFSKELYMAASQTNTQASLTNGQALFVSECLQLAQRITDEDAYYSLVPQPKASEDQDAYHTHVCSKAYAIRVSKAVKDTTAIANFLEVFGYHSSMILYPEYINYYKSQCFCEEEAAEMLDMTIKSATWDLDQFVDGGMVSTMASYLTAKNMLTKAIASKSKAADSTYQSGYVDKYADL